MRHFALMILLMMLTACAMGPDRARPHVAPPASFRMGAGGEAGSIAVYRGANARKLAADAAAQHLTFLRGRSFVTSGDDGTLRVYDEASARLLHTTRIPVGSYNVQYAAGRVLTPSLAAGTLCVLDERGRLRDRTRVAASSHDACLAHS